MKCDRYIGTGATTHNHIDEKAVVNANPSNACRIINPSEHAKSQTPLRSQTSFLDNGHGNKSRRESLQVPNLSSVPESENSASITPSKVLIKQIYSDVEDDTYRHNKLEHRANHCIVIEMHELKNNIGECNGIDKEAAGTKHQATTIREYEVLLTFT